MISELEAAVERPAPGLHRIAERVERRIVEIDAAGEEAAVVGDLDAQCRRSWCRD